jgi:DNA polymerase-4
MQSSGKKYIAHLDLDCFFVSVERIKDPSLIGKEVIVGGSPTGRGVVASASYEARKFGVRSAMPTGRALRLCPQAIVVHGHYEDYGDYSRRLYERICELAPIVQRASIDEMYMDFTGCEKLYGNDLPGFMKKLQKLVWNEFMLPCTIALASNKTIAKIAADKAKPNGVIFVPHGTEKEFLAPLPVDAISGVGKKTAERLKRKNFFTIADLQAASREALEKLFGSYGGFLFNVANGKGSENVHTDRTRKSISQERTFFEDIDDPRKLEKILFTLSEGVCTIMRSHHWKARTVTMKMRYSDFETITRRETIEPTNYDPDVFHTVKKLLHASYNGKLRIRLLGVGLSNFVDETQTGLPLFDKPTQNDVVLVAVDKIKKKFGSKAIHVGSV